VISVQATGRAHSADYADFAHTGPGTLAGRYLRLFWQPIYVAADLLPGHAKPLKIMSEDFTLYRGESGTPHLVAPRCAHRGTQLSTGWVEGDCVRCFYHGWKYDASGQCVEMPAEDPSFPSKVQIRSYPTEEYLGLVFAYLGDDAPPPLPRFRELEEDGVLTASAYFRACNYFNNIENGADPVHIAFAHPTYERTDRRLGGVPAISGEETPWGITIRAGRPQSVDRVTQLCMPNILYFKGPPEHPESGWEEALAWRVPIDDETHRSFNANLARASGDAAQRYRERLQARRARAATGPSISTLAQAVLRGEISADDLREHPNVLVPVQDEIAQVGQGVIADRQHERLGRSDALVILLRKLWARELRALAEGRPLQRWTRPEALLTTVGI
jgi:5,5'-dehydrodivanillate O-demethylase